MAPVLNLNNEVVKMRKDVKKVKVLTIRRLTRNISKLKSKKGTEELIQKNQRRAQRLLEEIHMIKKLRPDDVTKVALQKELNFEKVCKKPNSTVEIRAIARLATHPLLKQKITTIKDAVKAFKEARKNSTEQEAETEETFKPDEPAQIVRTDKKQQSKQDKTKQSQKPVGKKPEGKKSEGTILQDTKSEDSESEGMKSEDSELEGTKSEDSESEGTKSEDELLDDPPCEVLHKKTDLVACNQKPNEDTLDTKNDQKPVLLSVPEVSAERNLIESVPDKPAPLTTPKLSVQKKPVAAAPEKQVLENKTENKSGVVKKTTVREPGSDSSDIDDSDKEDKEYFDDSTEERFYKQSSGFEDSDSDSDNDFFIGKVRRTKKKKSSKGPSEDKVEKKNLPTDTTKPSAEGIESHKGNSAPRLESVFCNSLSNTKQKSSFIKRETKFPPVRDRKPVVPQAPKQMRKPQAARNSAVKSQSKPETVLHPSWEASRKRKEQSQIAVFQGKKIVFDD